jgi:type 1 fimbria pilin
MNPPITSALLGLVLLAPLAYAQLEEQGELSARVPIVATLTLSTCNLVLTDRNGTPMPAVLLEQIESGVVAAPPSRADFALTPRSGEPHCLTNLPDVTIQADYSGTGTGNIINRGSAGNVALRLWGIAAGGPRLFSALQPTLPLPMHGAGALWFSAELNPLNPSLAVTAGTVDASASFDVTYK